VPGGSGEIDTKGGTDISLDIKKYLNKSIKILEGFLWVNTPVQLPALEWRCMYEEGLLAEEGTIVLLQMVCHTLLQQSTKCRCCIFRWY
jgi:hypothetical protein